MKLRSLELTERGLFGLHEWMTAGEVLRLLVCLGDIGLKGSIFDTPLPASADLDRCELFAAYECIDLRAGDVEDFGHIGEGQEALFSGHMANFAMGCLSFRLLDGHLVDLEGV